MTELTFSELNELVQLIDNLPADECHPSTLALRDKLVAMSREILNTDS